MFSLHGFAADAGVRISLNDIPIEPWLQVGRRTRVGPHDVSGWLRTGTNTLELTNVLGAEASLDLRVDARTSERKRTLLHVRGDGSMGTVEHRTFESPAPVPTRMWDDAAPLSLDDATRDEAIRCVVDMHAALARADVDAVLAAKRYLLEERGRLEGHGADLRGWMHYAHAMLHGMLVDDGYRPIPLNVDALAVERLGGGRILEVRDMGAQKTLRMRSGDNPPAACWAVYLARIDGRLRWVRS